MSNNLHAVKRDTMSTFVSIDKAKNTVVYLSKIKNFIFYDKSIKQNFLAKAITRFSRSSEVVFLRT